jgi:hypothetical protein
MMACAATRPKSTDLQGFSKGTVLNYHAEPNPECDPTRCGDKRSCGPDSWGRALLEES